MAATTASVAVTTAKIAVTTAKITVELDGRDLIEYSKLPLSFRAIACHELQTLLKKYLHQFPLEKGGPEIWPPPPGNSHSALLIRELILKCQGKWQFPYQDEELCHCRAVRAHTVDQAIIAGAHSPEQVSRQTSASTACGTCRPDVEKILAYRLK